MPPGQGFRSKGLLLAICPLVVRVFRTATVINMIVGSFIGLRGAIFAVT